MTTPPPLPAELRIGDVLCVRTSGLAAGLIRFGAALRGDPNLSNHVAVMHHWTNGVPWAIEGKPGGVGYADARRYITSPWTLNNCGQPGRSDEDRAWVAKTAEAMLGTPYDWAAIASDTLRAFNLPALWATDWNGLAPGHVVCSSFASFLYEAKGWGHPPGPDRGIQPADWDEFIIQGRYNVVIAHA